MYYKKILALIAVLSLLAALVIPLAHYWGVPLKNAIVGIATMAVYVVLIAAYFLRYALIFLGVFAIYRILKGQYNERFAV